MSKSREPNRGWTIEYRPERPLSKISRFHELVTQKIHRMLFSRLASLHAGDHLLFAEKIRTGVLVINDIPRNKEREARCVFPRVRLQNHSVG
jgi:hypothetical protein